MSKAPQNRTITLSKEDRQEYKERLLKVSEQLSSRDVKNKTINQDIFDVIDLLPSAFVDLLFVDPPYNLSKTFNGNSFKQMSTSGYMGWMDSWLQKVIRLLKPTASIYICGDWRSSAAIHLLCEKYFKVRNRITFQREKGRGAKSNWKNNSEDIWFCTISDDYCFNSEAVKLKKKVIAPYRDNGKPKDWIEEKNGKFRLTFPSNVWTDITIPYWSMLENTPHPTQKPEKLLAKIILASSRKGDFVFDPFAGVGSTGVVAKKLGRNFLMVELEEEYCLYSEKRLDLAENDRTIQGYRDGTFWERNIPLNGDAKKHKNNSGALLFAGV